MSEDKGLGSAKRFGVRYGAPLKYRVALIETVLRGKHTCPYCNKPKAKRISVGIWSCTVCKAKFTAKAYSIAKPATETVQEAELGEIEEAEEVEA